MEVIAEGVETQEHVDALRELGCEYAQGFFFHRPVPAAQLTDLLG
jgi:EAL domain-containing protein (putative c-di-GMP-specific phosphodiesterase class I)